MENFNLGIPIQSRNAQNTQWLLASWPPLGKRIGSQLEQDNVIQIPTERKGCNYNVHLLLTNWQKG
jgi:hypothetical protein